MHREGTRYEWRQLNKDAELDWAEAYWLMNASVRGPLTEIMRERINEAIKTGMGGIGIPVSSEGITPSDGARLSAYRVLARDDFGYEIGDYVFYPGTCMALADMLPECLVEVNRGGC